MNKFSLIIPLYNKEKDVFETIQSVLNQTYPNFEIIIIDDGSTDNSIEIVKNINDKRIQVFSKNNEGVSIARNYGVEKATTEFIAFLDADDYWYPNHLEELNTMILKFPNSSWFATSYEKRRNKKFTTSMVSPIMDNGENWFGEIDDFFKNSYIDCLAWTSAVCMKKEFFKSLKGFDTTITHGEDTDLWIRAALQTPLIFSNKITARHNLISSNRSSTISVKNRNNLYLEKFIKEEKTNPSLKKNLDLNRYSLALKHKLSGDQNSFKTLVDKIDVSSLNNKQQFIIKQNRLTLKLMGNFQKLLEKLGVRLSSF